MYHYKVGDVCPFCGQVIPETAPAAMLATISAAASALNLPEPDEPMPDILCELPAKHCAANKFNDKRCCRVCDKFTVCVDRCQNDPSRCRQSDYMTTVVQYYDVTIGGAPHG